MKLFPALALVAAAATVSAPALADEALAKAKNCMACHAVDKKLVGPALQGRRRQVRRPEGRCRQARAEGDQGRRGRLGQIPMPANAQVNDAEAKAGRLDPDPQVIPGSRLRNEAPPCAGLLLSSLDPGAGAAPRLTNLPPAQSVRRDARPAHRRGARSSPSPSERTNCSARRPGREADAEDRADVRLGHARQHAFSQAARRLDRLAVEEALLPVPRSRSRRLPSRSAFRPGHGRLGSPAG